MKSVSIKTNKFRLAIDDENGDRLGIMEFYPNDPNLVSRIQKGYSAIKSIIEKSQSELEVSDFDADSDDIMANADFFEKITKTDEELKKELNKMFDSDFSSIFQGVNLAMPTSDGYLIENVLEAVMPEIEKVTTKFRKESEKKYQEFKEKH